MLLNQKCELLSREKIVPHLVKTRDEPHDVTRQAYITTVFGRRVVIVFL